MSTHYTAGDLISKTDGNVQFVLRSDTACYCSLMLSLYVLCCCGCN